MRILLATALAAAGCATGPGPGARVTCAVAREGDGTTAVWVFKVTNGHDRTLKIATLEFAVAGGAFESVGGMAEIAHASRQGTTTIAARETIDIVRAVADGQVRMKITYLLDGSTERWHVEAESP
jgi:hypothetical protein